jgi:hypothetical protein
MKCHANCWLSSVKELIGPHFNLLNSLQPVYDLIRDELLVHEGLVSFSWSKGSWVPSNISSWDILNLGEGGKFHYVRGELEV